MTVIGDDSNKISFVAPKVLGVETRSFTVVVDDENDHTTAEDIDVLINEGETIVFAAVKDSPNAGGIYRLHETDAAPVKLNELWLTTADALDGSSPLRRSEEPVKFNDDEVPDSDIQDARWMPDGSRILFITERSFEKSELFGPSTTYIAS